MNTKQNLTKTIDIEVFANKFLKNNKEGLILEYDEFGNKSSLTLYTLLDQRIDKGVQGNYNILEFSKYGSPQKINQNTLCADLNKIFNCILDPNNDDLRYELIVGEEEMSDFISESNLEKYLALFKEKNLSILH